MKQFTNYWHNISPALDMQFITHRLKILLLEDFLDHLHYTKSLLLIQSFEHSLEFKSDEQLSFPVIGEKEKKNIPLFNVPTVRAQNVTSH